MEKKKSFLAAISVLLSTAGATSVQAQIDADQSQLVLEEVIVTAQRRAERLQDIPISIGVVSGEALESQNITSLVEVSSHTAGVVIRHTSGGDQIAVRGVSSGFNPGFEQSVATFVDGVYRPRSRSSFVSLFDVDRVEILKGPQTTYFGANAIAGALNITTRKPGHEPGVNVLGYYSPDDNEHKIEVGTDLPLSETFAVRLAGRINGMDAISENTYIDERGDLKTRQFRASFAGDVSETFALEGRFDYARIRNTGALSYEATNCPPQTLPLPPAGLCARALAEVGDLDIEVDRKNQAGFLDIFDLDLYEGVVTATIELNGADLISTTAYQDQEARLVQDLVALPLGSPLGVSALVALDNGENFEQFSQEIRLQSSGDGPFSYMAGLYYEQGETNVPMAIGFFQAPFGSFAAPFFDATDLIVNGVDATQDSTTWSAFSTLSYDITADLTASVGLRYSSVTKEGTRYGYVGTIEPFPSGAVPYITDTYTEGPLGGQQIIAGIFGASLEEFEDTERTDKEWMPSANLTYRITPDLMTYVSYAHGFKAGGYNLFTEADIFGPEEVDAFEVGAKASWFDRRLTTNLTLFLSDYDNLQEAGNVVTGAGTFIPFIGNVAESRAKGAELEINANVADGFFVNASVAYVESKYLDYPDAPCSLADNALFDAGLASFTCPIANLKGVTRPNAPEWSGSISGDYSREIGTSGLEMRLGTTVYFRSEYFLQSTPEDLTSQDDYTKVDLRASIGDINNGWDLSLIGKNITDEDTVSFGGPQPSAGGSAQFIAERGRSVAVQLRMNFGASR